MWRSFAQALSPGVPSLRTVDRIEAQSPEALVQCRQIVLEEIVVESSHLHLKEAIQVLEYLVGLLGGPVLRALPRPPGGPPACC